VLYLPAQGELAVHAITPVCAAALGIRTFLDPPIIAGRHVLR
jgi:2,4-diaminopentanoate dehydrogenase